MWRRLLQPFQWTFECTAVSPRNIDGGRACRGQTGNLNPDLGYTSHTEQAPTTPATSSQGTSSSSMNGGLSTHSRL